MELYPQTFFLRHLAQLVRESPFLERLILDAGNLQLPEYVDTIARCFSQNSSLGSCTLMLLLCPRYGCSYPLQKILVPFTTRVQSDANVELVLKTTIVKQIGCEVCLEAIADLVARNTTLEKLEVGDYLFPICVKHLASNVMASAVGCNRTLKEFRFRATVAELKELVLVSVPDASGRQANTSLSRLELCIVNGSLVRDCVTNLAKLLGSNNTLKHVQVSEEWWSTPRSWDFRKGSSKQFWPPGGKVVESRMRGKLERMLNNELRRNTSLQSLSVGSWKLFREGTGEWQTRYEGPCLAPRKEYVVKVCCDESKDSL